MKNPPHTPPISPSDDAGQTMAEYGVLLALVTMTVVVSITLLGNGIVGLLTRMAGALGG